MSDAAGQHEHLSAALQAIVGLDPEISEGSFLVGYVVLAEYADPDGSRWFVSRQGDAFGPELYPWAEEGYLRQGMRILDARQADRQADE